MRLQLCYYTGIVDIEFGGLLKKYLFIVISGNVGKDIVNLYFGVIFLTIEKVLITIKC